MSEQWKDIPGYEGVYQASTEGRIRSVDRIVYGRNWYTGKPFPRRLKGHILRPGRYCKAGHLSVVLGHGDAGIPVHQLIARTFIGPQPAKQEVRHKNGDPTDNRIANLEYGTRHENILDVYWQGKAWRTLTADDVRTIRERIEEGDTGRAIARDYGVTPSCISSIKTGRTYSWLK